MKTVCYCLLSVAMLFLASCAGNNGSQVLDFSKISKEDQDKLLVNGYELSDGVILNADEISDLVCTDLMVISLASSIAAGKTSSKSFSKDDITNQVKVTFPLEGTMFYLKFECSQSSGVIAYVHYDDSGYSYAVPFKGEEELEGFIKAFNDKMSSTEIDNGKDISRDEALAFAIMTDTEVFPTFQAFFKCIPIIYDGNNARAICMMSLKSE